MPSIHQKKQKSKQTITTELFYINKIFETNLNTNYTNRALLYQDILKYFKLIERKIDIKNDELIDTRKTDAKRDLIKMSIEPEYFRIRELEKWLMQNNKQFLQFYTDFKARTPMYMRIANNDRLIKDCIDDLENAQLLVKRGTVKSTKNELLTPLYSLTIHGVIILILIRYTKTNNQNDRYKIQQILFQLIQRYFSDYNSYIAEFLSKIYAKALQKGYSESMVSFLLLILHSNKYRLHTIVDALNIVLHTYLMDDQTRNIFLNIYMEILDELDDNVKKIVLHHEKGDIESRIHLIQPPKDWEELWIQNIQNYSKLTLYCKCRNCSEKYPILIDYFDYRKGLLPSGILKKDCSRCNSKSTLEVYSDISKIT